MSDTRRRILETARELFNAHGLHRVGVRDIARAAEMSAGNLAYHFPTRDDLVAALVEELHQHQRPLFAAALDEGGEGFSLATLYATALAAMRNMLAFRFVLLSYAAAVSASPRLHALEAVLEPKRRRRHEAMLAALVRGGWVERAALKRSDRLYEQGVMISSGWLTHAQVRGLSDEEAVLSFAKLGCALLEPHCTPKGTRQMRRILAGDYDGAR